ncbi:MAG: division/cell wall cluster transcriptional repressor MraZ [Deltaproteobacteria bacterium]|nr:division/cell wall cluster transcriptional repressor MraZ [Deltaproteobacteria bacterium]
MLRGRFEHTIDPKGRISIPSKFRDVLLDKYDERLVLTNHYDGCLVAYPFIEWQIVEDKASKLPTLKKETADFLRFFISGATECSIDKLGRILVPPVLREHAKLEKDIVLVGTLMKIEIWAKARWKSIIARAEENIDEAREVLSGLGL